MGALGKYKNVEQRTDDDAYDDVMADGRTIGQARDELAAKSKARRKAKKEAQALANASYMKMIASEGAAEDDDIMGANCLPLSPYFPLPCRVQN